jgi:hypothetical protein
MKNTIIVKENELDTRLKNETMGQTIQVIN